MFLCAMLSFTLCALSLSAETKKDQAKKRFNTKYDNVYDGPRYDKADTNGDGVLSVKG